MEREVDREIATPERRDAIERRRDDAAYEVVLPAHHLVLAERGLEQQSVALMLGRVHLEDRVTDDGAEQRLVVGAGEGDRVTEPALDGVEAEHRHLLIVGSQEVVGADDAEDARDRSLVHRALVVQLAEPRMRVAHHADPEQAVLRRERVGVVNRGRFVHQFHPLEPFAAPYP